LPNTKLIVYLPTLSAGEFMKKASSIEMTILKI